MHNYYINCAYILGYNNSSIYYFINFFPLVSSCSPFFSFFLSLLCFFFLLSSPSSSNPHRPHHRPHHPHYRLYWLRQNPRLHGPEMTRQWSFGSQQLQWVLNGSIHQSRWVIMVARCSDWMGFRLNWSEYSDWSNWSLL